METLTPLKVKLLYTLKKTTFIWFLSFEFRSDVFFYPAFSRHQDISF